MNICMIVHNSGARDGRVMREAHILRAEGHAVTVVGVPEPHAAAPVEDFPDGVGVRRVDWYPYARRRRLISGVPRALLFMAVCAGMVYALYWIAARWLAGGSHRAALYDGHSSILRAPLLALAVLIGLVALYEGLRLWKRQRDRCAAGKEALRRRAVSGLPLDGAKFPAIRSRIPGWIPDRLLEFAVEPLDWFGGKTGKFSMYRYRSEALAAAVIELKPDAVHCHDCVALPAGWLVKRALGIPLVYDAHEIYEAVAARRFGATDYFARVHKKYLPRVDGFIAVNDSAAAYYRYAYPEAPRAVVIRNATTEGPDAAYDGRLHRAAGLPASEKILLYQGGFTRHRGLAVLVRAAPLLPDSWSLVMMGWGPLSAELERIALEAGADRKTCFIPAVPAAELLSWTQGATAGIVPYEDKMLNHWIATPNKLWEYPAAGVPLIVQPFPEMRRIVETYGCGWLLSEPLSPAGIAGLVESLTDGAIAKARAGCHRFIESDSWSSVYRGRLIALYKNLERLVISQETEAPDSLRAHKTV